MFFLMKKRPLRPSGQGVLLPSFYRRRAGAVKPENYTNSAQENCENKPKNDDFLWTLQQTVRTSQRNFATEAAGAFRPPPGAPSATGCSRPISPSRSPSRGCFSALRRRCRSRRGGQQRRRWSGARPTSGRAGRSRSQRLSLIHLSEPTRP